MPRLRRESRKSVINAKFCRDCEFEYCRCAKTEKECEFVKPDNEQFIADKITKPLRQTIIFEGVSLWEIDEQLWDLDNDATRLDIYYICFINDCLRSIRGKRIVYVFETRHIRDIMRFQPDVQIGYRDGIYYVTLPKRPRKMKECEIGI